MCSITALSSSEQFLGPPVWWAFALQCFDQIDSECWGRIGSKVRKTFWKGKMGNRKEREKRVDKYLG